jgi:Cys-rich four helix bundle protein (predicted Tat secretion target)
MNRREMLLAGATLTLAAQRALAEEKQAMDHSAHAGHNMAAMSKHHMLVMAAQECSNTAQVCLNHCLMMFADGNSELAKCAQTVNEVRIACDALIGLGNLDSTHLPAFAKAALDVCKACKEECDKHADKHEVCKACAQACENCADECELLVS